MASEPYVEIFIDTLSFRVQGDEESGTDAEALELGSRATVKRYRKSDQDLDLDSCRLKVNAYVPQTNTGTVDPMADFKNVLSGLQDCEIVPVIGRGGLVRARDERLKISLNDIHCRFILIATTSAPGPLALKTSPKKKIVQYLPGYVPVNPSNQRVDTTFVSKLEQPCFDEHRAHVDQNDGQECCIDLFLSDACDGMGYPFSHSEITDDMLSVLRFVCQISRCMYGPACRRMYCNFGHACHREDCGGKHSKCKFPDGGHGVDQTVHHWEMGRLPTL